MELGCGIKLQARTWAGEPFLIMPHPVYILTIYQPTTFIILVIVSNYDRQKHEL